MGPTDPSGAGGGGRDGALLGLSGAWDGRDGYLRVAAAAVRDALDTEDPMIVKMLSVRNSDSSLSGKTKIGM